MDQVALRLARSSAWTHLGGNSEAKKPLEVVVRAFEGDVLFATGTDAEGPDSDPVEVATGEGRRLAGKHFFVRPQDGDCLLSYRGI